MERRFLLSNCNLLEVLFGDIFDLSFANFTILPYNSKMEISLCLISFSSLASDSQSFFPFIIINQLQICNGFINRHPFSQVICNLQIGQKQLWFPPYLCRPFKPRSIIGGANYLIYYIQQMRRQPYKNLRYGQKVRESECFIEADGLQKKIRKFNAGKATGSIDAEMKMREIECFWKEGWQYNHTHHIYLEPKVTRPQFYIPSSSQTHPKLERYYELLHRYLTRLRVDNEDETNFKIDQRDFTSSCQALKTSKSEMELELEGIIKFDESIDESGIVGLAFHHLVSVFGQVSHEMIANFTTSLEISQNNMMNECLEEEQISHLRHIFEACSSFRSEEEGEARLQTQQFMRLLMEVIGQAKSNKQYSAVISTQPEMGELSGILHPFCWGLYSAFSKELLVKEAKRKRGRRYADEQDDPLTLNGTFLRDRLNGLELLAIQDNFKQEDQRHSKVVFLNLDGLESEFTIEFLRNFADNVMYVSFPKFEAGPSEKDYNNRFHKKIMYNFTRSELDILGCCEEEGLDAMSLTIQREDLLSNPEKYHETIDQIYTSTPVNGKPKDFNRNIFIFPIGLDNLQAEQDIQANDKSIDGYESQFIRFILRDQIYTAMKAFKPQAVLLSYTGKLSLENEHFLEMLQQLAKICPKIILFPNYTSVFSSETSGANHNIGRGIIPRENQSDLHQKVHARYDQQRYNPWEVELMDKLSIFLKVTAGYYTLLRPYEEEELSSKYKNSRVFRFIIYLYSALKNQYEHCKRRVESSTLETARASLEANIREHSKEINRCIPNYYERLFDFIKELLRGSLEDNQYSLTAEEVREKFPPTFEEDEPYLQRWAEMRRTEELRLASAKYHEISQLQLRQKSSREEYLALKDERMNNLDSLYRISFYYKEDSNQIVKLYKDAALLWKQNHHLSNKNHFYVALTNLFTPSEQDIQHYIAKPKLSNKKIQRCQIIPITFHTRNGLVPRDNIFKVWTEWSYAETAHQLILYWPTDFDFISYYLSKLLQRNYEPTVLRRLFAARKTNQPLGKHDSAFYEINIGDNVEVAPRWGCSSFNVDDQLYILGGSYGSEHSYLNLQNDVTTIDLTDNNPPNFSPAKLRNINKELYANEAFWGKLREGRKVNSFVRPRMEFQFYDRQELLIDEEPEQREKNDGDIRKIYMIGGYGEEFKTPYSLFVNFFYEIIVERPTRRLLSIKKIVVPEKVVPINVRAMIKNRGIYQKANILESSQAGEEQQKCKEGMTNNRHYFHHQAIYAIKNDQLHYKIKNLFAIELYENSKKDFYSFARRMGDVKNTQQPETVLIRKVEGSRHQVLVQIGDIYYLYSLNLQLKGQEIEEIPLMNESIIAVDTKKLTIFALISHSKHTHSKCILASESVRLPSQAIIGKQKHYALVLKEIMTFEESLNLHTLIICNANEITLLHGIAFENCRNKQYLIKVKTKSDIKKEEINMISVSPLQFSAIISFFTKKNNIINSINFLQSSEANYYFQIHRLTLDINRFSQGWKPNGHINKICFVHGSTILQKINFEARIDNFTDVNSIVILIYSSKKAYHIKLCEISNDKAEVVVQELTDRLTIQKYKCFECLAKIVKNQELYDDFNYFQ